MFDRFEPRDVMRRYLGSTRLCATCQMWEGERIAERALRVVHTPRHAVAGRCRSPVSWWENRVRQADSVCCFWQQWEPVRGAGAGRARFGLVMLGPRMPTEIPKHPS